MAAGTQISDDKNWFARNWMFRQLMDDVHQEYPDDHEIAEFVDEYFWVPLGLIAPLALFWAVSVLTWRVRVDRRKIRIVSVSGLMERPIAEVARVELRKGNLAIEFANGDEKIIPMFVGNLNTLCVHIERLRREQQ